MIESIFEILIVGMRAVERVKHCYSIFSGVNWVKVVERVLVKSGNVGKRFKFY